MNNKFTTIVVCYSTTYPAFTRNSFSPVILLRLVKNDKLVKSVRLTTNDPTSSSSPNILLKCSVNPAATINQLKLWVEDERRETRLRRGRHCVGLSQTYFNTKNIIHIHHTLYQHQRVTLKIETNDIAQSNSHFLLMSTARHKD